MFRHIISIGIICICLHFSSASNGCTWTKLPSVVITEGNLLQQYSGKTLKDCESLCDSPSNNGCKSLAYCPGSSDCYLYDKKLDGTEPLTARTDCTTSFRPCNEFKGIEYKECKWNYCQENNSCQSGWIEIDNRACGTSVYRKKMLHCCNKSSGANECPEKCTHCPDGQVCTRWCSTSDWCGDSDEHKYYDCRKCAAGGKQISNERFLKTKRGTLCNPQSSELQTEQECKDACGEFGYPYKGSWDGEGDFPKCQFTEGLNRVCHFNTNPNPDRTKEYPLYAAICKNSDA